MKTKTRQRNTTVTLKSNEEQILENLKNHHNFAAHKKEIQDFKRCLWEDEYYSKYLYTMLKYTALMIGLVIFLIFTISNFFPGNRYMESLGGFIILGSAFIYFSSFFIVRILYRREFDHKNHKFLFTNLRGNGYHYIRARNSQSGYNYLVSKHY